MNNRHGVHIMGDFISRHRTLIAYLVVYVVAVGTVASFLDTSQDNPNFRPIAFLLIVLLALMAIAIWLIQRPGDSNRTYFVARAMVVVIGSYGAGWPAGIGGYSFTG